MSSDLPVSDQLVDLFPDKAENRTLPVALPAGRIVHADEGDGRPVLWMSDGPTSLDLWTQAIFARSRSGLWPLLLAPLPYSEGFRPWDSGELYPEWSSSADLHDTARLLANWWSDYTGPDADSDPLPKADRKAITAPYGTRWPGLVPHQEFEADPEAMALQYATHLLSEAQPLRLGLVAADRGADVLTAVGWTGPMNYTNDTGEVAAVVRSWEDRFGARVVAVGFADLYISVAAPPTTLEQALHVAAEHFAFCPDNIWQGGHPHTLSGYAARLVELNSWHFWWD